MKDLYHKYGPFFILAVVAYLCYLVVKPFILPIISAALLAAIFYPLYKLLFQKTKRPNLSAILVILAVFVIVILPSIAISTSLVAEIPRVYNSTLKFFQDPNPAIDFIDQFSRATGSRLDFDNLMGSILNYILRVLQGFLASLPSKALNIFVSAFFLFYFLREGKTILHKISLHMPFGKKKSDAIVDEVGTLINAMVMGQIVTAVLQGIIAIVAYYLLGIEGALFWGILTLVFSMIPMIGPAFVYVPLGAGLILSHFVEGTGTLIKGIFLIIFGFAVLSSVDNIVKPMILSGQAKMHPAISFIAILGGLSAFGIVGLILGPVFVAILMALFRSYDISTEKAGKP
jgi:predicted PurR-regulated permease PerM